MRHDGMITWQSSLQPSHIDKEILYSDVKQLGHFKEDTNAGILLSTVCYPCRISEGHATAK